MGAPLQRGARGNCLCCPPLNPALQATLVHTISTFYMRLMRFDTKALNFDVGRRPTNNFISLVPPHTVPVHNSINNARIFKAASSYLEQIPTSTIKSSTFSIGFRGISRLGSGFIFLR